MWWGLVARALGKDQKPESHGAMKITDAPPNGLVFTSV
ncbi:hypothetical protein C943_04159 [Mariniradius saccharolyticus AK6]|uniref:Uncharacterized protein n=1 Tax=Mariniradius saccharolyticus AK6 TaxID=1239962 RepID=M7X8X3_9BACT|nr:hypothetical protein C943_04159 [Mariniradius saccharolyticus AK6]